MEKLKSILPRQLKTYIYRVVFGISGIYCWLEGVLLRPLVPIRARLIKSPEKLHLGCGNVILNGWVNIGWQNTPYAMLTLSRRVDLCADLRHGIPFPDNIATHIYSDNFIEHLTRSESLFILRESWRVLKSRGHIRVVVPNIEQYIMAYVENDAQFFTSLKSLPYWPQYCETPLEFLNTIILGCSELGWPHLWGYDFETLSLYLRRVGFVDIRLCKLDESNDPAFRNIDGRPSSCLAVEATKP